MKKFNLLVLVFFVSLSSIFSQNINLMTYNLRYDNPNDNENNWKYRKDLIVDQINYYEPDVIGTQEGLEHQVKWLNENLKSFSYVGIGRGDENNNSKGEFTAIFYNSQKFEVIKSNTFWLSETPDIQSKGWDASLNRICSYALLKEKSSEKYLWVFNTHFDHKGIVAREKSAELILKKMKELNIDNHPMALMGDFNLIPENLPIVNISKELNDSRLISLKKPFGPVGTFCSFNIYKPITNRIDYIFTTKENIIVNSYAVFSDIVDLRNPSDHLPVFIEIEIK